MEIIGNLIFGYRKLKISPDDLSLATSILLRNGIPSRINSNGSISVKERDFSKIEMLFCGRIEFEHSEPLGLYGKWKMFDRKVALCVSVIVSIISVSFFSSLIWDIRIVGNTSVTDGEIISALSECGVKVGDFWFLADTSLAENKLLDLNNKISWVNINRRGTVAYVKVIEKEGEEIAENSPQFVYSNVVAATDCVIEEITVKSGTAVVGVGEAVKKGDVLIIGVLPDEAGGGFCRAEGAVIGRVDDKVEVFVNREYEKKVFEGKKLYSISIDFFNFSINIFKLYGNLESKYDIIENKVSYSLPNGGNLPFGLTICSLPIYETQKEFYSDSEICEIARGRMDIEVSRRLTDSDLLRIRTDGKLMDEGYLMSSDIISLTQVGIESGFNIE